LLDEPPDADPHVRWCERGRLVAAPYSIVRRPTAAIHADLDAGSGKALEILWAGEVAALP